MNRAQVGGHGAGNLRWGVRVLAAVVSGLAACVGGEDVPEPWARHVIDDSSRGADGVRLADANGDGLLDIVTGWEEGGMTRIYLNPGVERAKSAWPAITVGKTKSVEDAVFADLDGDGALDVVSCCEGGTRTVYVHWAPAAADYANSGTWRQQAIPESEKRMMWMFAVPAQIDGRNSVDIVAAAKGKGAQIGWFEAPADPGTLQYAWHPIADAGWVMSVVMCDMDGDGDDDVLASDRKGANRGVHWFENPGARNDVHKRWTRHTIGGRDREVMFLKVGDLDADGLTDVVVAAKPDRILFLRRRDASGDTWTEHTISFPTNTGNAKGVAVADFDCDGRNDIVFSCESATGDKRGVMWLSRLGASLDSEWQAHDVSGPDGIKFDRIEILDLDGDGDPDILTCEERAAKGGLGVFWYENPQR